jgi:tRNA threonylcarbamoyladenosine biosynthesis protein TsaB
MRHLEWLLPAAAGLLRGLGWGPEHIEAVAVSRGPGGFTGLRIGIATACGWARTRGVPLLGIGTLEALAAAAATGGLVLPVLDAHRGEVACGLYRAHEDGTVMCLLEPLVATPAAAGAEVAGALRIERLAAGRPEPDAAEPVLLVGDGLLRHGDPLRELLGARARIGGPHLHPRAAAVGILARPRLLRGEHDDPHLLLPVYGRRPAVRIWQETPERTGSG